MALAPALLIAGGGAAAAQDAARQAVFASTYQPAAASPTAIVGATVLTGTGAEISDATLLIRQGSIEAVCANLSIPEGYARVDGRGQWVTPGLIVAQSHFGVYPSPASPRSEERRTGQEGVRTGNSVWVTV